MAPSKKTSSELLTELYARAGDPPCSVLAMATPGPTENDMDRSPIDQRRTRGRPRR